MEKLKLIMSKAFFINANMCCVRRAGTELSADQLVLPIFKVADGITPPSPPPSPLYNLVFSPTYLHATCINFWTHFFQSHCHAQLRHGTHCPQPSHWWKKLLGQDPGLCKLLWRAASTTVETCWHWKFEKEIRFKNKLCNTNITATNCFDLKQNFNRRNILVVLYSYIEEDRPLMRG